MEKVIQMIKDFFTQEAWNYTYSEGQSVFITDIDTSGVLGKLHIVIRVKESFYTVHCILNNHAEKNNIALVAEYLHRANYGLNNGNFEFDYEDGQILYKTFVNFKDSDISPTIVKDSIYLPIVMYNRYGKNLLKIMTGSGNPKQLIAEVENGNENS